MFIDEITRRRWRRREYPCKILCSRWQRTIVTWAKRQERRRFWPYDPRGMPSWQTAKIFPDNGDPWGLRVIMTPGDMTGGSSDDWNYSSPELGKTDISARHTRLMVTDLETRIYPDNNLEQHLGQHMCSRRSSSLKRLLILRMLILWFIRS